MKIYTYNDFRADSISLAKMIKESGQQIDVVLGVARGGLALAQFLSYLLNVRACFSLNCASYDDKIKFQAPKITNTPDLKGLKSVLVVDDIIDSGKSVEAVVNTLKSRFDAEIFCASLFYKKSACIKPEFFVNYTDCWIQFPWEYELSQIKQNNE